jgi:hypothetical protein
LPVLDRLALLRPLAAARSRWDLEYPSAALFRETLEGLREKLALDLAGNKRKSRKEREVLGLYRSLLKAKRLPTHGVLDALREDLPRQEAAVRAALDVRFREPAALKPFEPLRAFFSYQRIAFDPALPSVGGGRIFGAWTKSLEAAEKALAGPLLQAPSGGADLWRIQEALAWTRLVRLSFAVAMEIALDHEAVWSLVDGDAGWWLSQDRERRIAALVSLPLFQELEALRAAGGFLDALGLLRVIPSAGDLQRLVPAAAAWRRACSEEPCAVHHLGTLHPWTFPRMPSPQLAPSAQAPQFFARPPAQARLRLLKDLWEERRRLLVRDGVVTHASEFEFAVSAGSLAHGGKHPPHQEHRNGAQFDVFLKSLPALEKRDTGALIAIPSHPSEMSSDDESDMPEPDGADLEDAEPPPVQRPVEWRFRADRRERERTEVALAFTECVYLTFPFSVIYASAFVTQFARARLLDRLDRLGASADPAGPLRDAVARIRERVAAAIPDPYRGQDEDRQRAIREGHKDHWHLSYDPHALGPEPPAACRDPARARRDADALDAMRRLGVPAALWALPPAASE